MRASQENGAGATYISIPVSAMEDHLSRLFSWFADLAMRLLLFFFVFIENIHPFKITVV